MKKTSTTRRTGGNLPPASAANYAPQREYSAAAGSRVAADTRAGHDRPHSRGPQHQESSAFREENRPRTGSRSRSPSAAANLRRGARRTDSRRRRAAAAVAATASGPRLHRSRSPPHRLGLQTGRLSTGHGRRGRLSCGTWTACAATTRQKRQSDGVRRKSKDPEDLPQKHHPTA